MENVNAIVNELVKDIETPEDVPVSYAVWAVGYNFQNEVTDAALQLASFDDPDLAVNFAKSVTLADIIHLAAECDCEAVNDPVSFISVEVETTVPDEEEGVMDVGTVFKKVIEIF